jgi:hypothetical protein
MGRWGKTIASVGSFTVTEWEELKPGGIYTVSEFYVDGPSADSIVFLDLPSAISCAEDLDLGHRMKSSDQRMN